MANLQRIAFRLNAQVNDFEFEMNGNGIGDQSAGTCELHLSATPSFPEGFDPVSCPMVCSHPTSMYFASTPLDVEGIAQMTGGQYAVNPPRMGQVYDAEGTLLMQLNVTGTVTVEGDIVTSTHQMRGFSRLPRIARTITPFDDYLLPGPAGYATAVARYTLLTESGEALDGITTVPYRWTGGRALQAPIVRRVKDIDVNWDGGSEVHAYYKTSLSYLAAAAELITSGA
jgi:hypothetical protein